MNTTAKTQRDTSVAARIAGEDIQPGDFVTILHETVELPSFLWNCSDTTLPADELVRVRYLPNVPGQPHKVIAICLPFVYVKCPRANVFAFDVRQQQLVRLDRESAREVWKQIRKKSKKKRR